MRIEMDTPIWVVLDPTPNSELGDVCFKCDMGQLRLQFLGGLAPEHSPMIFTTEEEAHEEAKNRLSMWEVARQAAVTCRLLERKPNRIVLHGEDGQVLAERASMTAATEKSIAAEVMALQELSVGELRERYAELFGEETRSRNRPWLFKACAWRIQELAFGGLSERAKQRAKELARECDVRPRRRNEVPPIPGANTKVVAFQPKPVSDTPPPGTVLTRRYKGREVCVGVLDDGFEYDGQPYPSLTAAVRAITGSHWNGRAFFGLGKAKAR